MIIAHVGGLPVEELLASATGAGAVWLLARGWASVQLTRLRPPAASRPAPGGEADLHGDRVS